MATLPRFFQPHPNLSDEVNRNIVQSDVEGGVFLHDLPNKTALQIQTQHHWYTIVYFGQGQALISGHPQYCPRPIWVRLHGSTWGGSMLKIRFIGRGMHLEFCHPEYRMPIVTSRIVEIRQCDRIDRGKIPDRYTVILETDESAKPYLYPRKRKISVRQF